MNTGLQHNAYLMKLPLRRRCVFAAFVAVASWAGSVFSAAIYLEPSLTTDGFVSVPVVLQVNPNEAVAGLQFDIDFDDSLYTLVEVYTGNAAIDAGKDGVFTDGFPGTTRILVTGMNQAAIPEGVVVTIILSPADPSVGGYLELSAPIFSDPFGNRVFAESGKQSKELQAYESENTADTLAPQLNDDGTADSVTEQIHANVDPESPQHDLGPRRRGRTPSLVGGTNPGTMETSKSNGSGPRFAPMPRASSARRKPTPSNRGFSDDPMTSASAPRYARSNEPGVANLLSRPDQAVGVGAELLAIDAKGSSASRVVTNQLLLSHLDHKPANLEIRYPLALGLIVLVLALLTTFRGLIFGFALGLLPIKNQQRP